MCAAYTAVQPFPNIFQNNKYWVFLVPRCLLQDCMEEAANTSVIFGVACCHGSMYLFLSEPSRNSNHERFQRFVF